MGSVKENIEILKKAQKIDGELYQSMEQLKEVPEMRAKIKSALESEKIRLSELEGTLKKLQLTQKEKDGELAQKETNVKKLDGQLSQVKTNKEYAALQQEIASLKADNSLLEEEIIRILDELEAAQEEVKRERDRLKQFEKEFQVQEQELNQKEKSLRETKERLKKERDEIVSHLPPDVRDLYERILEKKSGLALVCITGEVCDACQLRLRPQVVNEIYLAERLVLCDSCSRILYVDEDKKSSS